jgi:hypothetical protein
MFPLGNEGIVPVNHITYIPQKMEIKHAKHWKTLKKPTDIHLTELEEVSDSFFVTPSKGTLSGEVIPAHKLGAHN